MNWRICGNNPLLDGHNLRYYSLIFWKTERNLKSTIRIVSLDARI
jgi:hypothetical protein